MLRSLLPCCVLRILDYEVHSLHVDETNPWHAFVYTSVVVRIDGRCIEDGLLTNWIRLEGDWFTFPEGQPIRNAARKGRPNRTYPSRGVPMSEEASKEFDRFLSEIR